MSQGFDTTKPKVRDAVVSQPMRLNFNSLATHHAAATAPTDPLEGFVWMDTADPTNVKMKAYISGAWVTILANIQAGPPSQSNVGKYVHTQAVSASTWNIVHTLSTIDVLFTFFDGAGVWILPNSVTIIDDSTISVTFTSSTAGKAVLTG